jgi:hypothetical protein
MSYGSVAGARARCGLTLTNAPALTDAILQTMVDDSDREVDIITGKKWGDANAVTDFIDGPKADMFGNEAVSFILSEYPVQSITEFLELNMDATTSFTYGNLTAAQILAGTDRTDDYVLDPSTGKIILVTRTLPEGPRMIKVSYTYGHATVPLEISEISNSLAGIRAIAFLAGGIYDGVKSYSVPEMNVGKEQAERLRLTADYLKGRVDELINSPTVGRRSRTMVAFSNGSRWGNKSSLTN